MLLGAPKELKGKWKFENGSPVATQVLTEAEQKLFDEYCEEVKQSDNSRFEEE